MSRVTDVGRDEGEATAKVAKGSLSRSAAGKGPRSEEFLSGGSKSAVRATPRAHFISTTDLCDPMTHHPNRLLQVLQTVAIDRHSRITR
jgi:hypothetical protein